MKRNQGTIRGPSRDPDHACDQTGTTAAVLCLGVLLLSTSLIAAGPAAAQNGQGSGDGHTPDCHQSKYNIDCNRFGFISMESIRHVEGGPVELETTILLNTSFEHRDARWIMFSVRNVTAQGESPVTIDLESFTARGGGEIITTRRIQETPNEVNLWVDVLDLPVGEQITIEMTVGVTEQGAFNLETLVIPFDRGYEPIKDRAGKDITLYSSTLLAVNEATASTATGDEGFLDSGEKVPGIGAAIAVGIVSLAALAHARRWRP